MPEHILIGWLCIARHQFSNDSECIMPREVIRKLLARGWIRVCDQSDGCEGPQEGLDSNVHLTDAGLAITDLNAPEWGINPIPETSAN